MNAQRILTTTSPGLEPQRPARLNPIRVFGETEVRLLGPTRDQIAAVNRPRLRGRFVHRHKGKSLRRHPLLPIRHTVEVARTIRAEKVMRAIDRRRVTSADIKARRLTPLDVGTSSRSMMTASEILKTEGFKLNG